MITRRHFLLRCFKYETCVQIYSEIVSPARISYNMRERKHLRLCLIDSFSWVTITSGMSLMSSRTQH